MSKSEAKKIKDEHRHGHTLISDRVNEMTRNMRPICNRKTIQYLTFVRFYIEFERASMCDIATLTMSIHEQSEHVRVKK